MSRQQTTNREHGFDTARVNQLVNGGFEVWQRGAGAVTYGFSADRWSLYNLQGTAAGTFERDTTNQETGSACMKVNCTNVGTAFVMTQVLENWRDLKGKPVALTMRVKSPVVGGIRISVNDSVAATYFTNTVANAYETISIVHNPVAANTTYLWIMVSFLVAGVYYLDSAMLVPGAVPTEFVPMHPTDDLLRCQRYYERVGGTSTELILSMVYSAAGQTTYHSVPFKVTKGGTPSVTVIGVWPTPGGNAPVCDSIGPGMARFAMASTQAGVVYSNPQPAQGFHVEWNPS